MEIITINCPKCKTVFFVKAEPGKITCPNCGLTDEIIEG